MKQKMRVFHHKSSSGFLFGTCRCFCSKQMESVSCQEEEEQRQSNRMLDRLELSIKDTYIHIVVLPST